MRDMTHSDAMRQITQRASTDKVFRTRLLANPHEAIKEATGSAVASNLRIKCLERDPNFDVVIVLPDLQTTTGASA
ncbi:MAG: hypothetical protein AB7I50_24795 [Vicinamibacterales bacterium]